MFDDLVTTLLEALALLAIAAGAALAIAGPVRLGVGVLVGGLALIGSTTALQQLAIRTSRKGEQ